jgi:hypothetical protein
MQQTKKTLRVWQNIPDPVYAIKTSVLQKSMHQHYNTAFPTTERDWTAHDSSANPVPLYSQAGVVPAPLGAGKDSTAASDTAESHPDASLAPHSPFAG